MNRRGLTIIGATASVVVLFVAAYEASFHPRVTGQAAAPPNQSLTVAMTTDVSGFDPQTTASASTFEVTDNIFDTLLQTDTKGNLHPDLALSFKPSDHYTKWKFTLRPHVLFQNNKPFTAQDVVYTFERILNKKTADPNVGDFSSIKSVVADSPLSVTFTLRQPYAPFLSSLALPWAAILEKGTGATDKANPIGTGPYELVKWTPQQSIVLKRFHHAWDVKQAKISNATFLIVPDPAMQLLDLQSGMVDVTTIAASSAQQVKNSPNLKLLVTPLNDVQLMAMNNKVRPLNNILVRKAIEYAVNKNAIIQAVDFGYGSVIGSHMPPNSPYYVNLTGYYKQNLTKARALLSKAGYSHGLTLTMDLPQPYQIHVQTGEIIAQQLKAIGITVKTNIIPWSQWLSNVYLGRRYQLTVIDHTGRLDPAQLLDRYETNNKGNYFNFSDPRVNQDLIRASFVQNVAQRKALYADVQRLLTADAAAVYIQDPDNLVGMTKSVMGWQSYPIDVLNLRNVYLAK